MDINDSRELYELIRNLSRGLKKHGVKKVIRALKSINIDNEDELIFSVIDFIEKSVCASIGVPRDELFSFTTRGEITIARKFCVILISKFVSTISDEEIGSHYNRSRQVVFNTKKEFRLLKNAKQNKFHLDFLAIYNVLDKEVESFVKNVKISHK